MLLALCESELYSHEIGDDHFGVDVVIRLNHFFEVMMTDSDNLWKSACPHSERLRNVEHYSNLSCHTSGT